MKQRRRTRSAMTVLAAMTALLAMSVSAAFAQYPPDEDFGVTCTPESPEPGDTVECEIVGAVPGEGLTASAFFTASGEVIFEGTMTADEDGRASFSFTVPADAQQGAAITVSVEGEISGSTGTTVTVDEDEVDDGEPVEVADPDDADTLPVTGGQVLVLSLLGVGLVGGGALALRKRSTVA